MVDPFIASRFSRRALLGTLMLSAVPRLAKAQTNSELPPLIDSSQLTALSQDANLVLLDLQALRSYRRSHIPGAIHAWWQDTMELNNEVYGTVLMEVDNQQQRIDYLNRLGIGGESRVVAYDDGDGRWAARIVWFLRFLGHPQVAMLDGGFPAWRAFGGNEESGSNQPQKRNDALVQPVEGVYLVTPQLQATLENPETLLLDCRSQAERLDDLAGTLPIGQIPGSVWWPWESLIDAETRKLTPLSEIRDQLEARGIAGRRMVLYARFGTETDLSWLATQLLGIEGVAIYDRGWAGWASQSELEITPLD